MHASFQNIPGTQGHSQKQAKITELPVNPFAKSLGNVRAKEKYRDLCRGTWQGDYSATVHKTNKQRMASAAVWPWRVFTTQKQDDCSIVYAVNVFFQSRTVYSLQSSCGSQEQCYSSLYNQGLSNSLICIFLIN